MDGLFAELLESDADTLENSILFDRVYPLSQLRYLTDSNLRLSPNDFFQAWDEIHRAQDGESQMLNTKQVRDFHLYYKDQQTMGLAINGKTASKTIIIE
jgi:hypothetical protein